MMHEKLESFVAENLPKVNELLNKLIAENDIPHSLKSSMAYSVNAGGKRIRPLLLLATLKDLGVTSEDALRVACAVELVHTYSLIHDDLPCMDDDDFRRGKLTNHKVYGEAVAVLAGDALQALAFGVLTELQNTPAIAMVKLVGLLANTSGANGMVGGQILDIEGESKSLTLEQLEAVHLNKTGALLSFCVEAGAVMAELNQEKMEQFKLFSRNIGLAFQIQDDILDVTSTTEMLGKNAGSDETSHKTTYPSLLGLDVARQRLTHHHQIAKESLEFLNDEHSLLGLIADYIIERQF